jgi:hypothetical protein
MIILLFWFLVLLLLESLKCDNTTCTFNNDVVSADSFNVENGISEPQLVFKFHGYFYYNLQCCGILNSELIRFHFILNCNDFPPKMEKTKLNPKKAYITVTIISSFKYYFQLHAQTTLSKAIKFSHQTYTF